MTFPLSIFALNKEIFFGDAESVSVPASQGRLQILPRHIPLITRLEAGNLIIEHNKEKDVLPIAGGILEVNRKEVVILVNF